MWTDLCLGAAQLVLGPVLLFRKWDHLVLALFFRLFPHTDPRMNLAEFFIYNPLASSWIFAAVFYFYWRLQDQQTPQRRKALLEIVFACLLGASVTLLLRPWLGAPSPARNPDFQGLFPRYLWGSGTSNSFPSHATLVYFLVAVGIWRFSKRWSAALGAWVVLAISIPRIYLGGHYPSDVVCSIILAFGFLWVARRAGATRYGEEILGRIAGCGQWTELILFLWLFELAEGFRASFEIAHTLARSVVRIL